MKMNRTKKVILSLVAIVLISYVAGMQTANANWVEGFVFDEVEPVVKAEKEEAPANPAMEYSAEVLRLINLEREKNGLSPLKGLDALKTAANTRAKEVSVVFAHVRLDGTSPRTVFAENKLNFHRVGENIAHGYSDPTSLVQAWMNSDAHRNVILRAEYTHAELGYYKNESGEIFCSMLFFTPAEG